MTPEDEAYEEALRRIREAEETGALELDLSTLDLNRLPRELERLTSLQALDLSWCTQLSGELSPLTSFTSLRSLNLSRCWQLSGDLSPLSSLTSLLSLNLEGCSQLSGDLTPLASLTSLQSLDLSSCILTLLPKRVPYARSAVLHPRRMMRGVLYEYATLGDHL